MLNHRESRSHRQTKCKAILGGTFNPPHLGHINGALNTADALNIQTVYLMPCKLAPHKSVNVSDQHRVNMVQLCCNGNPRLKPELIELQLPSPSYTVKTLKALKDASGDTICFFIGADSLYNLHKWYEWEQLLAFCHIVVMRRHDETFSPPPIIQAWLDKHATCDIDAIHDRPNGCVLLLDTPLYAISSTALRNAFGSTGEVATLSDTTLDEHNGHMPLLHEWVPDSVRKYIKENELYKS